MVSFQIENEIAINLLFSEAYHNYVSSIYPVADNDITRLGGVLMQMYQGSYDARKAKAFFSRLVRS